LEVFVLAAAGPTTIRLAEKRTLDQVDYNPANNYSTSTIYVDGGANLMEGVEEGFHSTKKPKLSIDNLFPNPTSGQITIAINSKETLRSIPLQVFDAFGKMVETTTISLDQGTNLIPLSMEGFSDGIYLIVLPNGSHQNLVKRFIKMK